MIPVASRADSLALARDIQLGCDADTVSRKAVRLAVAGGSTDGKLSSVSVYCTMYSIVRQKPILPQVMSIRLDFGHAAARCLC
jgi:hypothetical protein